MCNDDTDETYYETPRIVEDRSEHVSERLLASQRQETRTFFETHMMSISKRERGATDRQQRERE
jgi:hypothetical protein